MIRHERLCAAGARIPRSSAMKRPACKSASASTDNYSFFELFLVAARFPRRTAQNKTACVVAKEPAVVARRTTRVRRRKVSKLKDGDPRAEKLAEELATPGATLRWSTRGMTNWSNVRASQSRSRATANRYRSFSSYR